MSWYVLGEGGRQYRPLDVHLTLGPDLALRLHDIWTTIEAFAEPLERLCLQQAKVSFEVIDGGRGALAASIRLAEAQQSLRIVLEGKEAAFYWQRGQEVHSVQAPAEELDRSVYLIMADLAGRT